MSDESELMPPQGTDGDPSRKRKRRRRRRKRRDEGGGPPPETVRASAPPSGGNKGRRQVLEVSGGAPAVPPASGRNPHRKRSSRARRGRPGAVTARRRRLTRVEMEDLADWLGALPETLLASLYRGLGGQPKRVPDAERMIQLAVRAIAQGSRLGALLRQLHERDRKALAALLQSGGVAHADELYRTLVLAYGGHEREWKKSLSVLAERGVVMASPRQDDHFFYIVPDPLVDGLIEALEDELALPTFDHDDVRIIEHKPFSPPLDFSITTLATYFAQHNVRLTQRHDVYRHDKEELDAFFSQLWEADGELFNFHLDFLMMHGMVELRGDHLSLNRDVMEEWLQLEPEDQRDLIFRALDRRFDMAEWVLWAVHGTQGSWVAERPLVAVYRHWKKGKDWRQRYQSGAYAPQRSGERDSFTFSALVQCGLLELGQWGQEKFYRLTPRALALLEPPEDDGFRQFYLTPDFKMMAPAGLAPILLYRMGEIADLTACDRANTFVITEQSIEAALEAGWKRDDVLQFLRENSQLGLPDNVEQTLKGWIGHRGDVEFHDLTLITVHRSQIRRLEGHKRLKPFILHRFAPGMYAVDRTKIDEVEAALVECGFSPAKEVRKYPGAAEAVEARQNLHRYLAEAREAARDPMSRQAGLVEPSALHAVPGVRTPSGGGQRSEPDLPPKLDTQEVRALIDRALARDELLDMVYLAKNGQRIGCSVQPQRLAFKGDSPVLVGLDLTDNERRTFVLERIERLRLGGGAP
ncbi:MAG: helicase-associated domain-containing protein [Alphaproteobacteria bacterium]|nr:helicase-associated domain-containing protein [Alphaproteobacteria bacterium]